MAPPASTERMLRCAMRYLGDAFMLQLLSGGCRTSAGGEGGRQCRQPAQHTVGCVARAVGGGTCRRCPKPVDPHATLAAMLTCLRLRPLPSCQTPFKRSTSSGCSASTATWEASGGRGRTLRLRDVMQLAPPHVLGRPALLHMALLKS